MTSATRSSLVESCGPEEFKRALVAGAAYLELNHRILDDLNVFPVPDGDTGSNMVATYCAAVAGLGEGATDSLGRIAELLTHRLERNSRGNSGFIVASFLGGFLREAAPFGSLSSERLRGAFAAGLYRVCNDLFAPVEGTMVTVIRSMLESMEGGAGRAFEETLRVAVEQGRKALFRTPELLPVLAKAGVVDSGALGFVFIMEGWLRGLRGQAAEAEREGAYRFEPSGRGGEKIFEAPAFRYCTELVLERRAEVGREELLPFLSARGDSLALMSEGSLLKLHLHTNEPREVIEYLSRFGELVQEKVEDMREQMALTKRAADESSCYVLAFVPGSGFVPVFADLGVGASVEYGKDLPSAGEILDYLKGVDEESVILLPNNKNVLPACLVAKEKSAKIVAILSTADVVQGIAAMYGYSGNDGLTDNLANMRDCMDLARSILVFACAKDADFGGVSLRKGEYFAQAGGELVASDASLSGCALRAIGTLGIGGSRNLTIYSKGPAAREEVERIRTGVLRTSPDLEVEARIGAQYREELILCLE